jgi:hypothetical protein
MSQSAGVTRHPHIFDGSTPTSANALVGLTSAPPRAEALSAIDVKCAKGLFIPLTLRGIKSPVKGVSHPLL